MAKPTTPQKKVNSLQKEYLIDFMEKNYEVLFGTFTNNDWANVKKKKWSLLGDEFNKVGPPRDVAEWRNVS